MYDIKIKKYISCFIYGVIITSCIWAGFIFSSFNGDTNYKELYLQSEAYNRAITIILDDRQVIINRLSADRDKLANTNSEFESSIIQRETAIITATADINSIATGIDSNNT